MFTGGLGFTELCLGCASCSRGWIWTCCTKLSRESGFFWVLPFAPKISGSVFHRAKAGVLCPAFSISHPHLLHAALISSSVKVLTPTGLFKACVGVKSVLRGPAHTCTHSQQHPHAPSASLPTRCLSSDLCLGEGCVQPHATKLKPWSVATVLHLHCSSTAYSCKHQSSRVGTSPQLRASEAKSWCVVTAGHSLLHLLGLSLLRITSL